MARKTKSTGSGPPVLTPAQKRRFGRRAVKCVLLPTGICSLADYFAVLDGSFAGHNWWFRGHSQLRYRLIPSALRFAQPQDRAAALSLLSDFRRIAEIKQARPPRAEDELGWRQVGQHYGLPTQLLDWTENALAALYFACHQVDADGLVFVLNPLSLNQANSPIHKPKILDAAEDAAVIARYLNRRSRGLKPVALNPVWNSERIILQKGTFTLHPFLNFELGAAKGATPSLAAIPIPRESKEQLMLQLRKVGVDEITLFPELEHAASEIKRRAGLTGVSTK